MNGNSDATSGYSVESTYPLKIKGVGTKALDVSPKALALATADRVVLQLAGKKFRLEFPGHSPFEPHPSGSETPKPRIFYSDASGKIEEQVHPGARAGKYTYEIILEEKPEPDPAKGALLINVTAAVIIRGPVDPV